MMAYKGRSQFRLVTHIFRGFVADFDVPSYIRMPTR